MKLKIPQSFIQLFLYLIVGVEATIVEWSIFYICDELFHIHYIVSTTLAFAFSTLANWGCGRSLLFRKGDPHGILHELISIYAVSIIGLLANLGIMALCIELMHIPNMIAKIIATMIVFLGNFIVRKLYIYKV